MVNPIFFRTFAPKFKVLINMKKGFNLKGIGKVEKNIDACVKLHKLIDSGDEQGAISLINSEKGIDVSYEYNQRLPIFSAINSKMYDLFEAIVSHPTFDSDVEDGFGESVFQSLLYMYSAEETQKNENEKHILKKLIDAVLKCDDYPFNRKDLTEDTALITSCDFNSLNWVNCSSKCSLYFKTF